MTTTKKTVRRGDLEQDLSEVIGAIRIDLEEHFHALESIDREIVRRGWRQGVSDARDDQKDAIRKARSKIYQARSLLGGAQLTEVQQQRLGRRLAPS